MVGPHKKEYFVHGAVLSVLSKPLETLLYGPYQEALEFRVIWPDVDDKTFVRFVQWAYTKTYITEEPATTPDDSPMDTPEPDGWTQPVLPTKDTRPDHPLYSLVSMVMNKEYCRNQNCNYYRSIAYSCDGEAKCLSCKKIYSCKCCKNCNSAFSYCPQCGPTTSDKCSCKRKKKGYSSYGDYVETRRMACPNCLKSFSADSCSLCLSVPSGCPFCNQEEEVNQRTCLAEQFLNKAGTAYPSPTSNFIARENAHFHENYSEVFLCHARLYVLGDIYDIAELRQLSIHRLHATLKTFTLYPSRMNDIATLAKYIFKNTRVEDEIRDMITLYYSCIIKDASKYDGLKSLIDENPDFAFGLISHMAKMII